ncbi:MAG: fatty acid metabolism transcriptional regulator FadR [Proteobacteria bacterium]|nr:fatty acid metabolism transcriptional regulator FadR [Pseudomonadota bacterium]
MSQTNKFRLNNPLMKPTQYAEHSLVISILNSTFPPGAALPAERALSSKLGVTRQTLREALQRLAKDRWITIQHGKPTVVNNYWQEGGMGILNTMVEFSEFLPDEFITHLLEARVVLLPACAKKAVPNCPDMFFEFLKTARSLEDNAIAFAEYDWQLQTMMVKNSDNMVFPLLLNDFEPVFSVLGEGYFAVKKGRTASQRYYFALSNAIGKKKDIENIVRQAMEESIDIWKQFKHSGNKTRGKIRL